MLKISKDDISKSFFMIMLLLFWGRDHFLSYAKTVLLKLPYVYLVADYIIPLAVAVCIVGSLSHMMKAISYKDILFFLGAALAYCLNLLIYRQTHDYLLELSLSCWTTVFPIYFLGLRMDAKSSLPWLYRMSMVNIWLLMTITFLFGTPMDETRSLYQGAMGRAYNLLPQIMMVCIYAFDRPNLWNISTFAASSVYLLTCGTRGAVLCLFVFVVVFIILHKPIRKNAAMYCVMLILMIGVLVFYNDILIGMRLLSREMGMSERVINKLFSGSFFVSGGRDNLKSVVIDGIFDNPILGYGIAGDRTLIGVYAHNIFLELLASYGVIPGTALFLLLVLLIFNGYRKADTEETQKLILLLFCTAIVKLFMSSTYLQEELFFLLLGVCVSQVRSNGSFPARSRYPENNIKEISYENL